MGHTERLNPYTPPFSANPRVGAVAHATAYPEMDAGAALAGVADYPAASWESAWIDLGGEG